MTLPQVRQLILEMGTALGREEAAAAMAADFDRRLAALQNPGGPRPTAALYEANGYTSGSASLGGQILLAAGFSNIADDLGYSYAAHLPLEQLVLADPELLVATRAYRFPTRGEEVLAHPAVRELLARGGFGQIQDADWICGTPHVLRAAENLAKERSLYLERERRK
jgi:iron complex transport system substrate-binding protein